MMENDGDPILSAGPENEFKKLKTIPVFSTHVFVSFIISMVGVILAGVWPDEKRCEAYFIMVYLRVAFWLITLVFDYIVKRQHSALRLNGFHNFYREIGAYKHVMITVNSFWNLAFFAVQTLMHHYYGEDFGTKCIAMGLLSPIVYVTLFAVFETIVYILLHSVYITKVSTFNAAKSLPDAVRGSHSSGEGLVGLTQRNASVMELLEKQADMITYLKDHNLHLSRKLMQLNSEVRSIPMPLPPQI